MTDEPKQSSAHADQIRMIILVAFGALIVNGAFFVLSMLYYNAHKIHAPGIGDVVDTAALADARKAFALLSAVVALAVLVAERAPREVGHALATLLGLASLAAAFGAFDKGLPLVMPITLLVTGMLMPALAYGSWKKSRVSWAFLIALVAVFGGVDLFGAPKVRGLLGIGLWTAMILPCIQTVTVVALAMLRRDYQGAHIGSK
ncbi:MAG: hypothetical protein ACM31C_15640 [Acidobacteriota bacterium]